MSVTSTDQLDLAAVFARNRELYGDLRMEGDTPPAAPPAAPAAPATPPAPAAPEFPANTPVADMTPEQQAAYWRDKAQKHEKQWKATGLDPKELEALRSKAERFDKAELEKLDEVEREKVRADAAEKRAAELEARTLRAEIAAAKGVPAALITGSTKEELEASADALIAFRGDKAKPDFGGGDRGGNLTDKPDFDTQIADAQKAGNHQLVIRLRQEKAAADRAPKS